MNAQRKTRFESQTNRASTHRLHCPPDGTDDSEPRVVHQYSPKVLVGDWQTRAALQREYDQWLRRRDCARCVDLRGVYCSWKPDVILRREVRNGGHLYDRPLAPDDDCRLMYRGQLKSLYDQHYNERPATYPAHVDCPDSLPDGPTNFGLLDRKAAKWQEEIASLVELRMGPSLYRESFSGHDKDNETKDIHVGKNDFQSSCLKADTPMPNTCSMSTSCKPSTTIDQHKNTNVLSTSCMPSTALSKCDNTKGLSTADRHSTALDRFRDKPLTICSVPSRNTPECDCGSASAIRLAFENVILNSNVETELAVGNKELKYNVTERNIKESSPQFKLPMRKVPERELRHENNVPHNEFCTTNIPECEFPGWNIPDSEFERKEFRECEFPGRDVSESELQRENPWECDRPGIQTPPYIENDGTRLRFATGLDAKKSGCARKELRLTGNDVRGWGLAPEIDLELNRGGQRYLPPTSTPTPFVLTANNRSDACHCCLNPSVI